MAKILKLIYCFDCSIIATKDESSKYRLALKNTPNLYHEPFYCVNCSTEIRNELLSDLCKYKLINFTTRI